MLTLRKGSRMFSGRTLLLLGLGLFLCLTTLVATAAGLLRPAVNFPLPVASYHDQQIPSLFGKLTGRIQREPLNLVATIVFLGAIVHTFLAARFRKIAHSYQQSYEAIEYLLHAADGPPDFGKKHDKLLFRAQFFYFMGEVEAVFGIWLIPLFVASQLAKPGRSINPRFSIWRGRNFAAVPFPWSPGADAYRRSSVYVASLRGQLDKSRALGVTVCEQRLATKRDHPAGRPVAQ